MIVSLPHIFALQRALELFDRSGSPHLFAEEVCRLARPLMVQLVDAPNATELYEQLDSLERARKLGPLPDLDRVRQHAMVRIAREVSSFYTRSQTAAIVVGKENEQAIEQANDKLEEELRASLELPKNVRPLPVAVAPLPAHGGK